MYFVAPVCFNSSYCGEESIGDSLLSFDQCCFEFFGVMYALPGECLPCPKTGNLMHTKLIKSMLCCISIGDFDF